MKNPKISVVIPVYNAENTIGNILEKLIDQEYRNIEIIAVNDGSKDDSWKILKIFSKKDERVIAVDQKNAGASTARNVGINKSTGEFITFVDSDDDISDKLISELAKQIKDNSDFIMCGMSMNDKEIVAPDVFIENKKLITQYVLKSLLTKNLLYGPCCKLFRRSIIVGNNIQFPAEVKYGEDTVFVLNYLSHANNIINIQQSLYYYNFQSSGLASVNSTNIESRHARNATITKFLLEELSLPSLIMYILLRIRWALSMLKSLAKSVNYRKVHK